MSYTEPTPRYSQPQETPVPPNVYVNLPTRKRSRGMAILLAVFFGPVGLLYWDPRLASTMIGLTLVTLGVGAIVTYPWAIWHACLGRQG